MRRRSVTSRGPGSVSRREDFVRGRSTATCPGTSEGCSRDTTFDGLKTEVGFKW